MTQFSILEGLIDRKVERILKLFFKNKDELFHVDKVSKKSKVPLATTFRIIKRLVGLGIVTAIEIGKFKVYKFNANKKTELLVGLIK